MTHSADLPVILADIGGTNTRVALARAGSVCHETIRRFSNAESDGLPAPQRREVGAPLSLGLRTQRTTRRRGQRKRGRLRRHRSEIADQAIDQPARWAA